MGNKPANKPSNQLFIGSLTECSTVNWYEIISTLIIMIKVTTRKERKKKKKQPIPIVNSFCTSRTLLHDLSTPEFYCIFFIPK